MVIPGRPAAAVAFAIAMLLAPVRADAQGLTGTMTGTVKDAQGGVVAGAVIRVTSPVLGSPQRTTSGDKGDFRVPFLPPGDYVLIADLPPKFATSRIENIRVGAGGVVDQTVVLLLAGVTDSVTIQAKTDLMHVSGIQARFGAEDIRSIPSRRFGPFSLVNSIPGVSPTSPSSGSINTASIFGSSVNSNQHLIDGSNNTCPCQGVSRAEPILDVIQELNVQLMGASVEFGNIQGGVINVVTRQGGARFTAETSYYGQMAGLTAQPIVLPVARTPGLSTGYERNQYRDFTAGGGGPVVRDRAWFYAAVQSLRDFDSQPGTDPALPRKYQQLKVFGKLNWRPTPSIQLMHSFHREQWVNPQPPTVATPFVTTQRLNAVVPNMTLVSLTHLISDRTMWEARLARFLLDQNGDPSSGDRTTPAHTDEVTGIASGNVTQITRLRLDRVTAKAMVHRYQNNLFGLDHQFKAGIAFERGLHRLLSVLPGGVRYNDRNGEPFQAIYREPSIAGGVFQTPALFVSDTLTVRDRAVIDVGLRYDYSRAINPDLPVVSRDGNVTPAVLPGAGVLYTNHVLSPRLAVNVKLDASGLTMLRSSYGQFNQGVLTGELDPISQGTTPTRTMAYDAATGGYTKLVSIVSPKLQVALDPETRAPRSDEVSLVLDREITGAWRASVGYIWKYGRDYIAWIDRGGQYRAETRTLSDGTIVPVQVLTNDPADRRFVLTNPPTQFDRYDALVVAVERRMSGNWAASGSYTYSRARGLQVMSNGLAEDPQFSTIARPGFLTFGQDPNDFTNAEGRLANDRPHVLRATTTVRLPWQGVYVAANFQHFSGKPWAATTQLSLPQGSRRILLEPRGSRRLSSQSLLDVRVSKTIAVGAAGTVDLIFDVLNVLGDTAEESLVSDNSLAATFGQPKLFIDPRRAMIGVRFNFGGR